MFDEYQGMQVASDTHTSINRCHPNIFNSFKKESEVERGWVLATPTDAPLVTAVHPALGEGSQGI